MKVRSRESKNRSQKKIVCSLCFVLCVLSSVLTGCSSGLKEAREIKEAPMPQRYIETKQKEMYSSEGSLWKDGASLFEDRKAKRVNDLVTILVSEKSAASKKATTSANRDSSADYGLSNFFGMDTDFGVQKLPIVNGFYKGTNVFSPSVKGSGKSDFAGKGDTTREGTLTATITAKVVDVLPNGNMVLESRKEILVNNEKEILVFRGIVRPDDVSSNNTILSQYVADAQIYLVGDGVLDDKQSPGWLARFLDKIWPF
ncbi:flagellar basal body L-ring protein FlgH [Dissulfurispira thermophila]|uniref:Flagellar L-ring protein n=1 Tax=hot springs metagenome TaxID=433727 RepID=A0A5J4L8M5_9ZZZZ|nr:flagellar basal body L-ring protein FlgH [Dissulfurispira thermophila]